MSYRKARTNRDKIKLMTTMLERKERKPQQQQQQQINVCQLHNISLFKIHARILRLHTVTSAVEEVSFCKLRQHTHTKES